MNRILALATVTALLAAACAGGVQSNTEAAAADAAQQVAPADEATPTLAPLPTATPKPTPTSEPTVAPTATPAPDCADIEIGNTTYALKAAGATYEVVVFVPSSFDPAALTPVVLNWHGLGSNGSEQIALTAYNALAEAEGFIVAYPTGIPFPGTTNNSWELPGFEDPDRDDLAFAGALIDDLVERFCADSNRIYSTGMSNGGFFTGLLVCELGDRVAAAASIAGLSFPDDCVPDRAVPYIAFHGTADEVVLFDASDSDNDDGTALVAMVIPDEFAEFAEAMGCSSDQTETLIGTDVIRYDYSGCDNDVPLSFYEVTDGGHTWPGSPLGALLEGRLGRTTQTVSATELAWEFFKDKSLG